MNWSVVLELLLRSTALLLAGELLRRLSKTQTAAFRHRLLLCVFALLALLPVLSIMLPEIHIPLWTASHKATALVTIQELSSTPRAASPVRHTNWLLLVWLAGVVLASAPLFVGAVSAARMALRATPFATSPFQMPARRTDILVSSELLMPLTCGFLRPRILLPASAEHWSSSRLAAVLSHELAHVRRRDIAAQMAAHFIAALWWFQPLVWILRRTLREESELACDAEAIQSGLRPSGYAAELLAVAKTIGGNHRFSTSAIHMVRSGPLEKRLRAILNPPAAVLRPQRTYALFLALGSIAIACSALNLSPTNTFNPQGTSTMKRTILSALVASASLSAATFSGVISDPSGAPIPDVKVLVYNPDTSTMQETATNSDGKFSFAGVAAGQYILRMEKPGFASILREFDLKGTSDIDREFSMGAGGQLAADKLISTNEEQVKPVRIGGAVAESNAITKVQPVYPAAAKEAHTQGVVEIQATISKDGVPIELRVLSSPSDDLSQSALEAVRQWRYRPTLLNGAPVEIVTTVIVNYTLSQ